MAAEEVRTVLCIQGTSRKYAVEFSYVEEICKDMVLSQIPCLPEYFAGICNHKGTMVPVVYLDGRGEGMKDTDNRPIIFILRCGKYHLGVLAYQEPHLGLAEEDNRIKGPEQQESGIWVEKEYYMWNNSLYSLIDVEKSLEKLIVYV